MRYTLEDHRHYHHDASAQPLSLRQIMDRLVEHAFVPTPGPVGQDAFVPAPGTVGQTGSVVGPALNAYGEGDHVIVEAQLPGMKRDDIDVKIEQGVLTIQGEAKAEEGGEERNYLIREHRMGPFNRSLRLPETVDADAVQATYADGVLRLTLPRAERTKAHRIQIEVGAQKSVKGAQATGQGARGSGKAGVSSRTA